MRTGRLLLLSLAIPTLAVRAQDATVHIDASCELHRVSPLLTGACIEDVNHEIYGGLYSQMLFGESFQEPAPLPQAEDTYLASDDASFITGAVLSFDGGFTAH